MNDIYTFDRLISEYDHISIPKIQRDYAHGRNTEKAIDVRKNLLNDIFSPDKTISFDFIFGTAKISKVNGEKIFIPLDGQQRLTTLFLLYLYGYKKKGLGDIRLDKFSYETRKAARDFCKKIVEEPWPEVDDKLSESLKGQKWFMNYWLNDPTVEGMLTMLDAIHEKAINSTHYPKLNEITFRFFDLNEHGLSDDLYIKMNSRGKPLTAFENFKAAIDKNLPENEITSTTFEWIEDDDLKEETTFDAQWKYCIDRHWADCFWKYKEDYLIDAAFMRFVSNVLSAYWVVKQDIPASESGEKEDFLRFLLNMTGNEDYISFDDFKSVIPQNKETIEKCEAIKCGTCDMIRNNTLRYLADCFNSFYQLLKIDNLNEITCPSWEDNGKYNLIKSVLQQNEEGKYAPSFKDRAMFYALLKCPYIALIKENKAKAAEQIKHWMRVFWNIVEQAEARARNMIGVIKLVNELSDSIKDKSTDFYHWLIENGNSINSGFMKNQQKEEMSKARQIVEGRFTENEIMLAEKHPLLKGCISALFENDECLKVSFGQSIQDRIKLLDDLWNKDCENNYTLVKVLISRFDNNKKLESKLYLKKSPEKWKDLVTNKLRDCFRKIEDNSISASNINWVKILSTTDLIENSRDNGNGKVLGTYGEKVVLWGTGGCTWNAYENVILDDIHCNNRVLPDLVRKKLVVTSQSVKNCDCFWGWDINFEYNNHYFTWYNNNTICLMTDNWTGKKLKNDEQADESGNTYCFKVDNEQENIVNNLDCLIAQATADEQNKPCYDSCQNKVCE